MSAGGISGTSSRPGTSTTWLADVYESSRSIVCTGGWRSRCGLHGCEPYDCARSPRQIHQWQWKPVDFGTNCTGPDGSQPEICLTGNGNAMTVNKGSATTALSQFMIGYSTVTASTAPSTASPTITTSVAPIQNEGPRPCEMRGASSATRPCKRAAGDRPSTWSSTTLTLTANALNNAARPADALALFSAHRRARAARSPMCRSPPRPTGPRRDDRACRHAEVDYAGHALALDLRADGVAVERDRRQRLPCRPLIGIRNLSHVAADPLPPRPSGWTLSGAGAVDNNEDVRIRGLYASSSRPRLPARRNSPRPRPWPPSPSRT